MNNNINKIVNEEINSFLIKEGVMDGVRDIVNVGRDVVGMFTGSKDTHTATAMSLKYLQPLIKCRKQINSYLVKANALDNNQSIQSISNPDMSIPEAMQGLTAYYQGALSQFKQMPKKPTKLYQLLQQYSQALSTFKQYMYKMGPLLMQGDNTSLGDHLSANKDIQNFVNVLNQELKKLGAPLVSAEMLGEKLKYAQNSGNVIYQQLACYLLGINDNTNNKVIALMQFLKNNEDAMMDILTSIDATSNNKQNGFGQGNNTNYDLASANAWFDTFIKAITKNLSLVSRDNAFRSHKDRSSASSAVNNWSNKQIGNAYRKLFK